MGIGIIQLQRGNVVPGVAGMIQPGTQDLGSNPLCAIPTKNDFDDVSYIIFCKWYKLLVALKLLLQLI